MVGAIVPPAPFACVDVAKVEHALLPPAALAVFANELLPLADVAVKGRIPIAIVGEPSAGFDVRLWVHS